MVAKGAAQLSTNKPRSKNCRSRTVPFSFLRYFFGSGAVVLHSFTSTQSQERRRWRGLRSPPRRRVARALRIAPPASSPPIGGETVTTDCSPSTEADDICKSLERAVLKYFPALAWRRSVSTNCSQSAEAEDICTSLERAVLKFFAGPIENVDTFLFAEGDDSAVGDLQTACLPRPPTATDSQLTLFSAES